MSSDTIVAVATPPGVGGIAVVRLSGPDAERLALLHLSVDRLEPRRATFCRFADAEGRFVDEGVATLFTAPHSYTGEPTVEFSCHGSLYVQQAIVDALVQSGARMAEAGEYTLRAFRSGRLDLSQAEAVADLIDAVTPAQHRLAVSQLRGGYAAELKQLRQRLVDLAALLELELDFSQEDVEFADRGELRRLLATLQASVDALIASFALGNALKHGVPVAIVGAPNAGKSTLLNALLRDDRAIVSDVPGTTRDTVEGMLTIDGITFRLIDTAGLRTPADAVEALGIERSRRAREEADIVLEVEDVSLGNDYTAHSALNDNKKHIRVLNKCDLDGSASQFDGRRLGDTVYVCTSAKLCQGVEQVKKALRDCVAQTPLTQHTALLTNVRHRDALLRVQTALRQADEGLAMQLPTDLVAIDLRDALYHLGTVTGDVTNDEVLDSVFTRFCIGK